jgi:tRNA threonylcarbamoyladenosine modification (KEOPS) complex  Pcc1 subunit
MALKIDTSAVHTVQIDGADVKVVPLTNVESLVESGNTEIVTTVDNARKEERTNVSRELSKKIGVNLFDEAATKVFMDNQKNMIPKEDYEAATTKLEGFKDLSAKYEALQFDTTLMKNSVSEKHVDQVKKLIKIEMSAADDVTLEAATTKVLTEFPMFVDQAKKKAGINLNGGGGQKTEYDKHVEEKYKNNPYYKKVE